MRSFAISETSAEVGFMGIHYTEEEFIIGIRQNNHQVIGTLYKTHYQSVEHFIFTNKGSEQDAKDVFQEAFMVLVEQVRSEGFVLECKIKTYLYAVARRIWLRKLAERKKYSGMVLDTDEFVDLSKEDSEQIVIREQQLKAMQDALKSLGEPCATILKDFYLEKLSMAEITEKMGYTNTDNAKNQKYKCLQRLKKVFFQHYTLNKEP